MGKDSPSTTSLIKALDYFSLLPLDVIRYLTTFLDDFSLFKFIQSAKKFREIFKEELSHYLNSLKFRNYALSLGLFASNHFNAFKIEPTLFRHISYLQNHSLKEMATAIVKDDIKTFSNLCKHNLELLEQEENLFLTSVLFLVGSCSKQQFQEVIWQELCAKFKIDDPKLNKVQLDLPILSKLIPFSLYCHQHKQLAFLLKMLVIKMYSHQYEKTKWRLYNLFLRYFDIAIKLRDFSAISIIHAFYFNHTKRSLIEHCHYIKSMQNIDFELINIFMEIEKTPSAFTEENCLHLTKINTDTLKKILKKTLLTAIEHNQFSFLAKLYERILKTTPNEKIVIDLSLFKKHNPSAISKMNVLLNFFVNYKEKIDFKNTTAFLNHLLISGYSIGLTVILKLAPICDFKVYFATIEPKILFDNMNNLYLEYQQTSVLEAYFSFAETLKKEHQISSYIDYLKSHLREIAIPNDSTITKKERASFLAKYQNIVEKSEKDETNHLKLISRF